ncbi:MAG: helix-turn-helix domain-containing protein [Elusimicrobiota bacterium]
MPRTRCSFQPIDSDAARLLKLLGARRMAAIQAALGGRRIWIPKSGINPRCAVCGLRDECIRAWRRQGMSVARIAKRVGISAKTVYRVLSGSFAPRPG